MLVLSRFTFELVFLPILLWGFILISIFQNKQYKVFSHFMWLGFLFISTRCVIAFSTNMQVHFLLHLYLQQRLKGIDHAGYSRGGLIKRQKSLTQSYLDDLFNVECICWRRTNNSFKHVLQLAGKKRAGEDHSGDMLSCNDAIMVE